MTATATASQQFRIHLEYGHYEHYLYWGFDLIQSPSGALHLHVRRDDGTSLDVPLGADVAERLWGRVERLKVWELPSTDYSRDLSDDLYHLGASVVLLRERRSFAHQVPIGVAVRVPTCVASKEHMLTFYHFVTETCRDVEQLSGVTVPNAVALRWKARLALMGRRDNVPDED